MDSSDVTSTRFSAVSIPLAGSIAIELRGAGVIEPCLLHSDLPQQWRGVADEDGIIELRRSDAGEHLLRIREGADVAWSLAANSPAEHEVTTAAEVLPKTLFRRTSRLGLPAAGTFRCVNFLGRLECTVHVGTKDIPLPVDIVSSKFTAESDFETMTEDIAAHVQQLLLQHDAPTSIPLTVDVSAQAAITLERFLYLRHIFSGGQLESLVEAICRNPHTKLNVRRRWRESGQGRSESFLADPFRHGRDWRRTGETFEPREVSITEKFETLDTEANQFVAFALREFLEVCLTLSDALESRRSESQEQAAELARSISACLSRPFFRELSPLSRIPLDSQVLQKRSGYREILAAWLLSSQAARLDWKGRADVFGGPARNVAVLYEYWLFFELRALVSELDGAREIELGSTKSAALTISDGVLSVRVRRGSASVCAFEVNAGSASPLRVQLWFDRTFSPTRQVLAGGAYSRHFRPDFTVAVFPARFAEGCDESHAEEQAENEGEISYLHFDAKYRNERIDQIFGTGEEAELDAEENDKATSTYRRADLYKMHAYNDAIRRTVASFVLYPGRSNSPTRFEKYHEIVPGVGAFAFSPGDSFRKEPVRTFLHDFLAQQSHRYSQQTRLQYWTHDTVREKPGMAYSPQTVLTASPAQDVQLVLGFVRAQESLDQYRKMRAFFVHAIEWRAGTRTPGIATVLDFDPMRADMIALFQGRVTSSWIAPVERVTIVTAEERARELSRPAHEMRAAYYYRFALGEAIDCPSRDVSPVLARPLGRPLCISVAAFLGCPTVT